MCLKIDSVYIIINATLAPKWAKNKIEPAHLDFVIQQGNVNQSRKDDATPYTQE